MEQGGRAILAVLSSIVGLAILSVILSARANTAGVISAGSYGFASILSAATAPVTGYGGVQTSGGFAGGGTIGGGGVYGGNTAGGILSGVGNLLGGGGNLLGGLGVSGLLGGGGSSTGSIDSGSF